MRRCGERWTRWLEAAKGVLGIKLALFLALVSAIVLVSVTFDAAKLEALLTWVQQNKTAGSFAFLGLYTLGVVLMFPAMVMAMAAGAIFGMLGGSALAWVGSAVGQTVAFVLGRYLLRGLVLQYATKQFPKWSAIDRALAAEGWKLVTLLRLSPIAPWNVLNYALAVTAVPLLAYAVASSLAIVPYLVLFVYFGSFARNLADVFTGTAGQLDTETTIVMGVASGIFMVLVVWYTTHLSRKAIAEALTTDADDLPPEVVGEGEEDGDALLAAQRRAGGEAGGGEEGAEEAGEAAGGDGASPRPRQRLVSPRAGVEMTAVYPSQAVLRATSPLRGAEVVEEGGGGDGGGGGGGKGALLLQGGHVYSGAGPGAAGRGGDRSPRPRSPLGGGGARSRQATSFDGAR